MDDVFARFSENRWDDFLDELDKIRVSVVDPVPTVVTTTPAVVAATPLIDSDADGIPDVSDRYPFDNRWR